MERMEKNYTIHSTLHNFSNELAIIIHQIRRVFQTSVYETINEKSYFIAIVTSGIKKKLCFNLPSSTRWLDEASNSKYDIRNLYRAICYIVKVRFNHPSLN